MKRERLSFLVLIVEIAAIVLLHSAKNKQLIAGKVSPEGKSTVSTNYQLQAMPLNRVK